MIHLGKVIFPNIGYIQDMNIKVNVTIILTGNGFIDENVQTGRMFVPFYNVNWCHSSQ